MRMAELLPLLVLPLALRIVFAHMAKTVLQIIRGNRDNLRIIFLISTSKLL